MTHGTGFTPTTKPPWTSTTHDYELLNYLHQSVVLDRRKAWRAHPAGRHPVDLHFGRDPEVTADLRADLTCVDEQVHSDVCRVVVSDRHWVGNEEEGIQGQAEEHLKGRNRLVISVRSQVQLMENFANEFAADRGGDRVATDCLRGLAVADTYVAENESRAGTHEATSQVAAIAAAMEATPFAGDVVRDGVACLEPKIVVRPQIVRDLRRFEAVGVRHSGDDLGDRSLAAAEARTIAGQVSAPLEAGGRRGAGLLAVHPKNDQVD